MNINWYVKYWYASISYNIYENNTVHLPHAEAIINRKIVHVFVVETFYIQDISSQGKAKQK